MLKRNDIFFYEENLNLNLKNIKCKNISISVKKRFQNNNLIVSCGLFNEVVVIDSSNIGILDNAVFFISHNIKTNVTEIYTDDKNIVNYVSDVNNIANFKNTIIWKTKQILILADESFKKKNEKENKIEKEKKEMEYKLLEIKKLT